jgi:hypothetical protein
MALDVSQAKINESLGEGHKPLLSYNDLPDKDKDKPSVDSTAYMPNVAYLRIVKELGSKLGAQDD